MNGIVTPPNQLQFTQDALIALNELDRALANHIQWLRALNRCLVCSLQPEPDDMAEDAHRRCLFGRWYYGRPNPLLREKEEFASMGEMHQDMHRLASRLLLASSRGQAIDAEVYDAFSHVSIQFMTILREFQHLVISQVCTVDQLTGAWNRYAMSLRLLEELSRVQRTGQHCTLGLMDLDYFKEVNDRHGHVVGDAALQALVRFVKARLRSYDGLFRYGGEEFLLCLPDTGLEEAEALLNRIREEMAAQPFVVGGGIRLDLSASFGVAELDPKESLETSIERVDRALFVAKLEGRNRVKVWRLSE